MTAHESSTTRFQPPTGSPCALIEDLLPLYVEGEVSPGTRDLIVEHLANCEHCAGFLAGTQSVRAQLRHDQQSRSHVITEDRPAFQAMHTAQFAVVIGAMLAISMIGLFAVALLGSYGAQQLLALLVPLGAGIAACYAVVMLLKPRRGILFDRWLPLGAVAALVGLGMLVLLTQFDRLLSIAVAVFRHTPFYLLYTLRGEFAPILSLGAFGVMMALLVGLAFVFLRNYGQTSNPE